MFCCDICEQNFVLDLDLKNHMLEHNEQTQVKHLKCFFLKLHVQKCFMSLNFNKTFVFSRMLQIVILIHMTKILTLLKCFAVVSVNRFLIWIQI